MCGITGSYPIQDYKKISESVEKIAHRGPDARDVVNAPHATFGHSRLAIIDVAGGRQPMRDGDQWIVFNGEIYNYRELRESLPGPFETDSDTEIVLKLYQTHGPNCAALLDGMFAFAILDGDNLFLARDPIGIKPLYYAIDNDRLYFSSEIKAIHWLLERVKEFPPGHWWHSAYGLQRYYQLDRPQLMQTAVPAHPTREHMDEIRETMRAAVTKRLIADEEVGVGVSLSGGLDSSIIAALAREGRERLDTFAVGVPESEDLQASQRVAQYLGTTHHMHVYTFDDMLKALPEVIYHLESFDTALVRSAIPNYFLAQLASQYVKVMLTGEGADELFAGYKYLEAKDDPNDLHAELKTITGNLHNTNLQRTDRMTMAHGLEARVPFLDTDVISLAFRLPAEWKMPGNGRAEKALLRETFADCLPDEIVHRPKQKFSDGAGSIDLMAQYANDTISDAEFTAEHTLSDGTQLQSKEHLMYYRIFCEHFGDSMSHDVIGRTRSVVPGEIA